MDKACDARIVYFIRWIADDAPPDLFKRGEYPNVILPMCVIRCMNAAPEPSRQQIRETKGLLDGLLTGGKR